MVQEKNPCAVIHWKSGKVKHVVSGAYDAEILALSEGLEEAIIIRKQLLAMTGLPKEMIEIEGFSDSRGAVEAIGGTTQGIFRGKSIGIEVAKIKEMRDTKEVAKITWLDGVFEIADGLTKPRKGASREPVLQAIEKGRFMY